MMNDGDDWFAPRRFGYGAGLPIRWQGWVLLLGYLAAVLGLALWLGDRDPTIAGIAIVALTLAVVPILARHTRGGFRWHWGWRD